MFLAKFYQFFHNGITLHYTDDIKKRLRRVEGQIGGVQRMIEKEKDCKEVVVQLSAIRSAVDRVIALVVAANLEKCIREEQLSDGDRRKLVQEAVDLLLKSR
jgi:DNA-binding FrmR family transcriptional regulator